MTADRETIDTANLFKFIQGGIDKENKDHERRG